jgi:hypothetical protein
LNSPAELAKAPGAGHEKTSAKLNDKAVQVADRTVEVALLRVSSSAQNIFNWSLHESHDNFESVILKAQHGYEDNSSGAPKT